MNVFFLQLFVFTDGEVTDTFSVIREVRSNRERHRYEENVISGWQDPSNVTCNPVPPDTSVDNHFRGQNNSRILVLPADNIFLYTSPSLLIEKSNFINNINSTSKSFSFVLSQS